MAKPAAKSFFVDKAEFEAAVKQRLTRKMRPETPRSPTQRQTQKQKEKQARGPKNDTRSFDSTGAVLTPLKD